MKRLAGWVVALGIGLFTGTGSRAEELDLILEQAPGVEKGVMESGPRNRNPIQELDLLVDPEQPASSTQPRTKIDPNQPRGTGRWIRRPNNAGEAGKPQSQPLNFTVEPQFIIPEDKEELLGLPDADNQETFRTGGGRVYPVDHLVIPLQSNPAGRQPPLQAANLQRQQLIQSLQTLQDAYCRNAQLDEALAVRNMIRHLQAQAIAAGSLPEPVAVTPPGAVETPNAYDLRGQNGKTFYRKVTGSVADYVWGGENNVYTDDSNLATAAVHAGVLKVGETEIVRFTILAGKDSYVGSTRNGVTPRPWQSFGGSVRIDGAAPEIDSVYDMRGQDKPPFAVYVVGSLSGTVYGTGSYTDDSDIGTAAVHAGLLKDGEAGFVMVTLEGGKDSYEASTQNGVTTSPYGSWGGGFRLSAFQPVKTSMRLGSHNFILDVF